MPLLALSLTNAVLAGFSAAVGVVLLAGVGADVALCCSAMSGLGGLLTGIAAVRVLRRPREESSDRTGDRSTDREPA